METGTWDSQLEVFKSMSPPLRPHASELAIYLRAAQELRDRNDTNTLQVLVLGVTEELVNLPWPEETMLTAVDRSETMIHSFWPGDLEGSRKLIRSDWFAMPFHQPTFHLIVGDGVFNFMSFPEGYHHFAQMLSDLLLPSGRICVRVFTQLAEKEKTEEVIDSLHRDDTIDYFVFRYRLATSLQPGPEQGIYVTADSLDQYLTENGNLLPELYAKSGYVRPKTILTDPTKSDYRISYPTEEQFRQQVAPLFDSVDHYYGSHTMAFRTPMFVLKKG